MLAPWKESYDQPRQCIKKQRHYFANKKHLVNAMVFPVVMYAYESWTIKKAEHQRIECFELWSWRRLLRVHWTARRSNQSILKEISPEYSLERLMLKLKFQFFGHLMQRANSFKRPCCWERLKAGGEGDNRGWDDWMAKLIQWTWVWASSWRWCRTGKPGVLQCMAPQSWTRLSNWITKRMLTKFLSEEQRNLEVWRHTKNNYCSQMMFRLLKVPKKIVYCCYFYYLSFVFFHLHFVL